MVIVTPMCRSTRPAPAWGEGAKPTGHAWDRMVTARTTGDRGTAVRSLEGQEYPEADLRIEGKGDLRPARMNRLRPPATLGWGGSKVMKRPAPMAKHQKGMGVHLGHEAGGSRARGSFCGD